MTILLSLITVTLSLKFKSPTNEITQRNLELFKYSPDDEYTLPENIDDDKPPSDFVGNVMQARTLSLENKNHGKGKFKYSLETQNGISLTQVGKLKDEKTFVISGSYSYTGADGRRYKVKYTADEFGYHPITELDLDIPEIQDQLPLLPPLKLIDLNNLNNNNFNQDYNKHDDENQGYNYENKNDDGNHGYSYDNPDIVPVELAEEIQIAQELPTEGEDDHSYLYPAPSPDLTAPKIFN